MAYFSIIIWRPSILQGMSMAHSFLLLSIPFHSLFIHPPIDKHLGYLQYFAMTSKSSLYGLTFSFLFSKYLAVELIDHSVGVF